MMRKIMTAIEGPIGRKPSRNSVGESSAGFAVVVGELDIDE
jgi:hypothetical protein